MNFSHKHIKNKEWSSFFKFIGNKFSIFILTKSIVIQKINHKYILIVGNPKILYQNIRNKEKLIMRDTIFYKISNIKRFDPIFVCDYVYKDKFKFKKSQTGIEILCQNNKLKKQKAAKIQSEITSLTSFCSKYTKLNIRKIFNAYFSTELDMKNLKKLSECEISNTKITNFFFVIFKKYFVGLFSYKGLRILKSKIFEYIRKNRYETFNESELIRFFKFSHFKIFNIRKNLCQLEFIRRRKIILRIMKFIFEFIVNPILSNFFYLTEGYNNFKVFYYTRKSWNYFTEFHLKSFLNRFKKTDMVSHFPVKPRCIPKMNDFRIIINKSKRNLKGKSENLLFSQHHAILSEEQKNDFRNSLIDYNQIFKKIEEIDFSNYFIFKFDINGCFDNIPHKNFTIILRKFLKRTIYRISGYNMLHVKGKNILNKKSNIFFDEHQKFPDFLFDKEKCESEIYWDDVYVNIKSKESLIREITSFITQNIITFQNENYVQVKGLPQGSILSPILCSLYFQYLDEIFFNKIIQKGHIFRYVDDFLIFTPCLNEIIELIVKFKSIANLGISMNIKKIESNFGLENIINSEDSMYNINRNELLKNLNSYPKLDKCVLFCGLRISCKGTKINLSSEKLNYSSAYYSNQPGQAIKYKIIRFFKKLHKKVYFSRKNAYKYQNIYICWIYTFRKILGLIRKLDFINKKFIEKLIQILHTIFLQFLENLNFRISDYFFSNIRRKAMIDSGLFYFLNINI